MQRYRMIIFFYDCSIVCVHLAFSNYARALNEWVVVVVFFRSLLVSRSDYRPKKKIRTQFMNLWFGALIWWYFSSDFRNVYEHLKMENYESPGIARPVSYWNTRDLCVAFDLGFGMILTHRERETEKKPFLLSEPAFRKFQIAYLSESNISPRHSGIRKIFQSSFLNSHI